MKPAFFILLALFFFSPAAQAYQAKVVGVADGDSLTVLAEGREREIRLYGIDAPERKQAFGQKAKGEMTALCAGKVVEVEELDEDSYGRAVSWVTVNGRSVNETMVFSGYAWVYRTYCRDARRCEGLLRLEAEARDSKRGLWRYGDPMPPWKWRQQRRT